MLFFVIFVFVACTIGSVVFIVVVLLLLLLDYSSTSSTHIYDFIDGKRNVKEEVSGPV
jgi:hypothetical protein